MSYFPLWGMAHMSARNGDISQQLNLSSTHSPPIPFIPSLSLEWRTRDRKGWTRVRKWRRWIKTTKGSKINFGSRSWASTTSHLMVSSRTLTSHYLETSPQTLTQVSLIAWMDHEDCKMTHHPKSKIKSWYNLILSSFSLIWIYGTFARNLGIHLFGL